MGKFKKNPGKENMASKEERTIFLYSPETWESSIGFDTADFGKKYKEICISPDELSRLLDSNTSLESVQLWVEEKISELLQKQAA